MYYVSSPYFNGKVRAFDTEAEAKAFIDRRSAKIAKSQNTTIHHIEMNMNIEWQDDLNIGSGNTYPSNALSNFAPHAFRLDGVKIASMEGFLQSLKTNNLVTQTYICSLVGLTAKRATASMNWQANQTLYWQGKAYARDSQAYTSLIKRAYESLFYNTKFRRALRATGYVQLRHTMSSNNKQETILTEEEFISNLTRLRERLH